MYRRTILCYFNSLRSSGEKTNRPSAVQKMRGCQLESTLLLIYILFLSLYFSYGFKSFQTKVPNGDSVANPCDGTVWQGVGHVNKHGGGERNPFGKVYTQLIECFLAIPSMILMASISQNLKLWE